MKIYTELEHSIFRVPFNYTFLKLHRLSRKKGKVEPFYKKIFVKAPPLFFFPRNLFGRCGPNSEMALVQHKLHSFQSSCTHLQRRGMWGCAVCWCLSTPSYIHLSSKSPIAELPEVSSSKNENGKAPTFYSKSDTAEEFQSMSDALIAAIHCMPIAIKSVFTLNFD